MIIIYVILVIVLILGFNLIKLVIRMNKNWKLEREREERVGRQTVYTISADPRSNDPANDLTDFFWDGVPHASSARNEPSKEDKDLPSYEEVMQLERTRQAIGSTTVMPANNNTTTSSVVAPVITVISASRV